MKSKNSKLKVVLMTLNVFALVGLSGLSFYFYNEKKDAEAVLGLTTEQKNDRLVEEINEVYDLPDEEPVVAIVTDPEQFKAEYPSFDDAQNGDYLLFFRKARLNVLYRQSDKKVIKTANVNVPISVEVVGSEAAIEAAQERLSEFGDQITITKTVLDGITQPFVFDVDEDQSAEAASIAEQIGVELGTTLPSSITPGNNTEIVIVVVEAKPNTSEPQSQSQSQSQEP